MADEEALSVVFLVEDGTCVSDANSFVSLEFANQYMTNQSRADWLALSDDEKKSWLIKGTQYIDKLYKWKGHRLYETQTLSWPRCRRFRGVAYPLFDRDGFKIKGVPRALCEAVCEAAFYGFQAQEDSLFTIYDSESGKLKRDKSVVSGAVEKEVEFFSDKEATFEYISRFTSLDSILRGLFIDPSEEVKSINAKVFWEGM